jgi:hypothetical protein
MRLTSADALASRQALNLDASLDLALVSCSDTLDRPLVERERARRYCADTACKRAKLRLR